MWNIVVLDSKEFFLNIIIVKRHYVTISGARHGFSYCYKPLKIILFQLYFSKKELCQLNLVANLAFHRSKNISAIPFGLLKHRYYVMSSYIWIMLSRLSIPANSLVWPKVWHPRCFADESWIVEVKVSTC